MENVKLLALFAENKIGQLARVTDLLAEANVNIRWVATTGTGVFGVVKLLVDHHDVAYAQLKHNGVPVSALDVLPIEVEDRPGGLRQVAVCLAQQQINVENASGFVANHRAVLLVEVNDVAAAEKALQAEGLRVLTRAEVLAL
ncbi:MAG: ACT domain-containing protein [Verrucomicrobiota bacterium]